MKVKKVVVGCIKVAFLAFAIAWICNQINVSRLLNDLNHLNWSLIFWALVAANFSTVFSAERTKLYLRDYGLSLSSKFCMKLYFIGSFFNTILPGGIGGDGYKIYLLWKLKKFDKILALRIALYERTNGFFVLALIGLLLLPMTAYIDLHPLFKIISILLIILITPVYFFGVKYVLKDKISTAVKATKLSVFVQVLQIVSAYLVLHALIERPSEEIITQFMFLFVVASIATIIPISIGGAGLRELTFLYGLKLLPSTSVELGIAFGLLMFLMNLSSAIIGGFVFAFSKLERGNA